MLLSTGEKWFNRFNLIVMLLIALAMLLPFLNVIAKSLSSNSMVMAGEVSLWPKEFNLYAYDLVFKSPMFMQSIKVTVFITLTGTLLTLFVVITSGYALSKKDCSLGEASCSIFCSPCFSAPA
ncbi:hypothetical protein N6H14_04775 [Paenibacillus sp. CC-CFT747]|nr:hypothetical protein N6H14_04775 [Paenibacillus sp. CC-CFT747]